jgi:hypothetical protein
MSTQRDRLVELLAAAPVGGVNVLALSRALMAGGLSATPGDVLAPLAEPALAFAVLAARYRETGEE